MKPVLAESVPQNTIAMIESVFEIDTACPTLNFVSAALLRLDEPGAVAAQLRDIHRLTEREPRVTWGNAGGDRLLRRA